MDLFESTEPSLNRSWNVNKTLQKFQKIFFIYRILLYSRNIFRRSNAKTNKKSVYQNIEDLFIELETIKDYSVSISHHLM